MIYQKMESRPPVQHPAGTKIEREFDKHTGNLVSETEEESYWLEILFVSIGFVVVLVAIFVGKIIGIGWKSICHISYRRSLEFIALTSGSRGTCEKPRAPYRALFF